MPAGLNRKHGRNSAAPPVHTEFVAEGSMFAPDVPEGDLLS